MTMLSTVGRGMIQNRRTSFKLYLSLRGGRSPTWQSASPCGAKHRPAPEGPERERIATALMGFAMTVVFVTTRTISAAVRYRPPSVIARRAKPDVAIRFPCGAKHRPAPEGPERERIATALTGFAMTVVFVMLRTRSAAKEVLQWAFTQMYY